VNDVDGSPARRMGSAVSDFSLDQVMNQLLLYLVLSPAGLFLFLHLVKHLALS
jgi:hypothetical protein